MERANDRYCDAQLLRDLDALKRLKQDPDFKTGRKTMDAFDPWIRVFDAASDYLRLYWKLMRSYVALFGEDIGEGGEDREAVGVLIDMALHHKTLTKFGASAHLTDVVFEASGAYHSGLRTPLQRLIFCYAIYMLANSVAMMDPSLWGRRHKEAYGLGDKEFELVPILPSYQEEVVNSLESQTVVEDRSVTNRLTYFDAICGVHFSSMDLKGAIETYFKSIKMKPAESVSSYCKKVAKRCWTESRNLCSDLMEYVSEGICSLSHPLPQFVSSVL